LPAFRVVEALWDPPVGRPEIYAGVAGFFWDNVRAAGPNAKTARGGHFVGGQMGARISGHSRAGDDHRATKALGNGFPFSNNAGSFGPPGAKKKSFQRPGLVLARNAVGDKCQRLLDRTSRRRMPVVFVGRKRTPPGPFRLLCPALPTEAGCAAGKAGPGRGPGAAVGGSFFGAFGREFSGRLGRMELSAGPAGPSPQGPLRVFNWADAIGPRITRRGWMLDRPRGGVRATSDFRGFDTWVLRGPG